MFKNGLDTSEILDNKLLLSLAINCMIS